MEKGKKVRMSRLSGARSFIYREGEKEVTADKPRNECAALFSSRSNEKERAVLIADVGSRVNSRVLRRKIYLFKSIPRREEANVDSVERFNHSRG